MFSQSKEEAAQQEEQDVSNNETATPRLNALNYLNVVFYILNFLVTYGVGLLGWVGNGTNEELSEKYQTLVTPKSNAFSIWAVIFTMQLLFVILQLFPRFRGLPMVQKGVFNYYILTCTFQAGWTFAFCFEIIWLSVIFILLIWISLVALLYSQYYVAVKDDESNRTLCEFWFLRFPFAIHCGWLTAASALNINVFVVDLNAAADIQLAVGIISLAVLHAISVWVIFGVRKANYTIAGVLSWANYWIYEELQDPKDSIIDLLAAETISGVSYAGLAVSIIILVQIVTRIAWDVYQNFCRGDDSTEDEKESLVSTSNKEGASIPVKIEPTDNV